MDRVRVVVWTGVVLLAAATLTEELNPGPEPTVYSIMDEHEDCGSGGEDYAGLERCLVKRYGWPVDIAEQFTDAIRDRNERDRAFDRLTDWDAFRRHAADLLAVYRALGVRDLRDVELDIYADSATQAFGDSIDRVIRDSADHARRIRVRGT